MYRNALLQECDDGAAAKESLRTLGYHDLHVAIRGGASFTHGWRERHFFIAAQGHLVPRASIFFRHAGVGRK